MHMCSYHLCSAWRSNYVQILSWIKPWTVINWAMIKSLWHPLLINGLSTWFLSSNENSATRVLNGKCWKRAEIPLEISAGSIWAGETAWSFYKDHRAHVGTISQPATWSISFRNAGLSNVRDKSESVLFIFLTMQTTISTFNYIQKIFSQIAILANLLAVLAVIGVNRLYT